jgi:hypothetical protein
VVPDGGEHGGVAQGAGGAVAGGIDAEVLFGAEGAGEVAVEEGLLDGLEGGGEGGGGEDRVEGSFVDVEDELLVVTGGAGRGAVRAGVLFGGLEFLFGGYVGVLGLAGGGVFFLDHF